MDILLSDISKTYGGSAVFSNFSCVFPDKRISCVSGKSGSGKTTLLRMLAGLEKPDSGSIAGISQKTRVSCVFQENRLFADMSAEKNIMLTARKDFTAADARALLDALGIDQPQMPVNTFSGGMQRRVALARALAAEYDLLLLDEPFAGLDEQTRDTVNEVIQKMAAGKTVIYAGHFPESIKNAAAGIRL